MSSFYLIMILSRRHSRDSGIGIGVSRDVERRRVAQDVVLRRLLHRRADAVAVANVAAAVLAALGQKSVLHELAEAGACLGLDVPAPAIVPRHSRQFLELWWRQPATAMLDAAALASWSEPGGVQHALHGPAEDLHRVVRSSGRHPGPEPGSKRHHFKAM